MPKRFRSYLFKRINEAVPRLHEPEEQPEEQPQGVLTDDHVDDIIHHVDMDAAHKILDALKIRGRASVTQAKLPKFKFMLMALLQSNRPLVTAIRKTNNPREFDEIVNFWKANQAQVPQSDPQKTFDFDEPRGEEELGLAPYEEPKKSPAASRKEEPLMDPQGVIHDFPPPGTDLHNRFHWAKQQEGIKGPLVNLIARHMWNNNHQPSSLRFEDRAEAMLGDYFAHGWGSFAEKEKEEVKKYLSLYQNAILNDMGENKLTPELWDSLTDFMAHPENKSGRLRADELRELATIWHTMWKKKKDDPNWKPRLTDDIIDQLSRTFKNQRNWTEGKQALLDKWRRLTWNNSST